MLNDLLWLGESSRLKVKTCLNTLNFLDGVFRSFKLIKLIGDLA